MADVSLFSFDDICFVNIAESHFVVEESKKKLILAEENQSFLVMKHKKLEQDIEEPRALNFELADGLLAELEHVSLSLCHQRFNRHLLFQLSMIIFQLAQIVGRIFHFFFLLTFHPPLQRHSSGRASSFGRAKKNKSFERAANEQNAEIGAPTIGRKWLEPHEREWTASPRSLPTSPTTSATQEQLNGLAQPFRQAAAFIYRYLDFGSLPLH